MQTIKKHFESIEDNKVRENALRNLTENGKDSLVDNLPSAIVWGFMWNTSPEGFTYWENIYMNTNY